MYLQRTRCHKYSYCRQRQNVRAFIHFLFIFYIGADFDAGCWVGKRETNKSGEEKNEPKRGRLVDQ